MINISERRISGMATRWLPRPRPCDFLQQLGDVMEWDPAASALGWQALSGTEQERSFADGWLADAVYGAPETVRVGLDELRQRTEVRQITIAANIPDGQAKPRSCELIVRAYHLPRIAGTS